MSLAWVARLPRYLWRADRTKQQSTASSSGALVHRAHCKGMSGNSETSTSYEDAPSEPRKIHIDYGRYAESAVDVGSWCWPIPTTVAICHSVTITSALRVGVDADPLSNATPTFIADWLPTAFYAIENTAGSTQSRAIPGKHIQEETTKEAAP